MVEMISMHNKCSDQEKIRKCPLFIGLSDSQIDIIEELSFRQEIERGSIIFTEGEVSDSLYIVIEGRIDLIFGGAVLSTLEDDSVIGELSLMGRNTRPVQAQVRSCGSVLRLDCGAILQAMNDDSELKGLVLINLSQMLADRLIKMNSALRDIRAGWIGSTIS